MPVRLIKIHPLWEPLIRKAQIMPPTTTQQPYEKALAEGGEFCICELVDMAAAMTPGRRGRRHRKRLERSPRYREEFEFETMDKLAADPRAVTRMPMMAGEDFDATTKMRFDPENLRAILELIIEYAPQVIAIVLELLKLFTLFLLAFLLTVGTASAQCSVCRKAFAVQPPPVVAYQAPPVVFAPVPPVVAYAAPSATVSVGWGWFQRRPRIRERFESRRQKRAEGIALARANRVELAPVAVYTP